MHTDECVLCSGSMIKNLVPDNNKSGSATKMFQVQEVSKCAAAYHCSGATARVRYRMFYLFCCYNVIIMIIIITNNNRCFTVCSLWIGVNDWCFDFQLQMSARKDNRPIGVERKSFNPQCCDSFFTIFFHSWIEQLAHIQLDANT